MVASVLDNLIKELFGEGIERLAQARQLSEFSGEVRAVLGDDFAAALTEGRGREYIEQLRNNESLSDDALRLLDDEQFSVLLRGFDTSTVFLGDLRNLLNDVAANPDAFDPNTLNALFARHSLGADDPLRAVAEHFVQQTQTAVREGTGLTPAGPTRQGAGETGADDAAGAGDEAAQAAAEAAENIRTFNAMDDIPRTRRVPPAQVESLTQWLSGGPGRQRWFDGLSDIEQDRIRTRVDNGQAFMAPLARDLRALENGEIRIAAARAAEQPNANAGAQPDADAQPNPNAGGPQPQPAAGGAGGGDNIPPGGGANNGAGVGDDAAAAADDGAGAGDDARPRRTPADGPEIELPTYRNGINAMTHLLKRSWSPYKLFTNWSGSNMASAPVNANPMIREVIGAVDGNMEAFGLADAMSGLQNDMNAFARRLNADPSQRDQILQEIDVRLSEFSDEHGSAFRAFETQVESLRSHVESTYLTATEYRRVNGLGPNDPLPEGFQGVLEANDGTKTGLLHVTDGAGQVIFSHRDALLTYLEDVRNMSRALQDPDFGREGARIRALADIEDPQALSRAIINGLNRITEMGDGARMRLHPKGRTTGPNGEALNATDSIPPSLAQEREALERALAEAYYNPYARNFKPGDTNLEHTWQQLEERYTKLLNTETNTVDWAVPEVNRFVQDFKSMYNNGFDQEALYTIHYLRMRRGDKGIATYPTDLVGQLRTDSRFNTDDHFRHWVLEVERAADISRVPGHRLTPLSAGRDAEKYYAEQSYFFRYSRRYRGTNNIAKPGLITITKDYMVEPAMRTGYYFLGAHTTGPAPTGRFFNVSPAWAPEGGNSLRNNPLTRSAFRLGTGGVFTRPGMYTVGAGAGIYALGTGIEWGTGEVLGEENATDLGLRAVGYVPLATGLTVADTIADNTVGWIPYSMGFTDVDIAPYEWVRETAWNWDGLYPEPETEDETPTLEDAEGRVVEGGGGHGRPVLDGEAPEDTEETPETIAAREAVTAYFANVDDQDPNAEQINAIVAWLDANDKDTSDENITEAYAAILAIRNEIEAYINANRDDLEDGLGVPDDGEIDEMVTHIARTGDEAGRRNIVAAYNDVMEDDNDAPDVDPNRLANTRAAIENLSANGMALSVLPQFNAIAEEIAESDIDLTDQAALSRAVQSASAQDFADVAASIQPETTTTGGPGFLDQFNTGDIGDYASNFGRAAGNLTGSVADELGGWYMDGSANGLTRVLGDAGSLISSGFSLGRRAIAGMDSRNSSLLGGALIALLTTNFIKNQLGFVGRLPFAGLIIFGAIAFGSGRFLNSGILSGNGRQAPEPVRTTTTYSTSPVTLAEDHEGVGQDYDWETIAARDEDADGQFAIQMSQGGTQFVDFDVLQPQGAAANYNGIIEDARNNGTFFPEAYLNGISLGDPEKWEYEAVETGTDIGRAIILTPRAANDPNAPDGPLVFDIAG